MNCEYVRCLFTFQNRGLLSDHLVRNYSCMKLTKGWRFFSYFKLLSKGVIIKADELFSK